VPLAIATFLPAISSFYTGLMRPLSGTIDLLQSYILQAGAYENTDKYK